MIFPQPGSYGVLFYGQYGNTDKVLMCAIDRHGVWRRADGSFMPQPKFDPANARCALVCAPEVRT